jgi:hypothetical protein
MLNVCFSMTKEAIKKHCRELKLYQTPHLNDVLYLHYKGKSVLVTNTTNSDIAVNSLLTFL